MKSKTMFGVIVLISAVFLQACKDSAAESAVDDIPLYAYYECALNTYRNGWAPENECLEENQKPTKAILEIFEEAERDYNIEQIEMFEYQQQQQLAQQERERQLAEEQQRQREEVARLSQPDFALEWFEDYSSGTRAEGWRIVALADQVTVTGVIVNRGNCKATLGADVPLWFMTDAKYPVTLTYGNQARFRVPSNCNVREINVTTSRGSWVSTYTR